MSPATAPGATSRWTTNTTAAASGSVMPTGSKRWAVSTSKPAAASPRADRIAMVLGHVGRAVEQDAAGGRGIRRQSTADASEEPGGRRGVRSAERLGEGDERAVRDAALELAEDALLPRLRIVQDRDRLRAELERGVGPPHRGIRGVESQHAPDPAARRAVVQAVSTGDEGDSRVNARPGEEVALRPAASDRSMIAGSAAPVVVLVLRRRPLGPAVVRR